MSLQPTSTSKIPSLRAQNSSRTLYLQATTQYTFQQVAPQRSSWIFWCRECLSILLAQNIFVLRMRRPQMMWPSSNSIGATSTASNLSSTECISAGLGKMTNKVAKPSTEQDIFFVICVDNNGHNATFNWTRPNTFVLHLGLGPP